jgi:multiple antibiotic resistance protein
MKIDLKEIAETGLVLFAVIDILGSIPIILNLKQKVGELHEARATFAALIIMISFLFLGEQIIRLFGIDVYSFAVAGSFVLLFLALEMILGINLFRHKDTELKSVSIVPIAFPLIAGAGTMTSILSLRAEYQSINIVIAIILNIVIVWIVLKLTNRIGRLLGPGGIAILQKVFGIILLAIAVKLFSNNASHLLD